MAGLFVCGAECGATAACAGHWDSLTGTGLTLETSIIEPGGGTTSYKWLSNASQAYLAHTLAQTTVAARFYFYFGVLPTGLTAVIASFINANGTAYVKCSTAGQIKIRMGASAADINVGSAVSTGAWHYIDIKVDCSGTTAHMYGKLDGGTEYSDSVAQTSANITSFRQGWPTAPTTGTLYIDQILLSAMADYPIGVGAVSGYRPTKDGTHTSTGTDIVKGTTATPVGVAITNATTDAYQWVDDATIDSTGDFWNQQTAATEYAEVGFGTISNVPVAVEVLVALSAYSALACTQKAVLWDGTTASDIYALGTVGTAHPTLTYKRAIYTAAPSGAWTVALFNALRFRWGYSDDANPDAYCDNVVLEVAYVPTTSFTGTGTGARVGYVVELFYPDANWGPGTKLCELSGVRNLGWSQYDRLAAKAFFTLSQNDPNLAYVVRNKTHVAITRVAGTVATRVYSGQIVDYNSTADDVVVACTDYLGLLALSRCGFRTMYTGKKLGSEIVDPEWHLAKNAANSILAFVNTSVIEDPLAIDGTTPITTDTQFGLLDQSRLRLFYDLSEMGRANTTNIVTYGITRTPPHNFYFYKNAGTTKNVALALNGRVIDYKHGPNWAAYRNDYATLALDPSGGAAEVVSKDDTAAANEGRRQDIFTIATLLGLSTGGTTSDQQAAAVARMLARGLNPMPSLSLQLDEGSLDPFVGWDLNDKVPVEIVHGIDNIHTPWRIAGVQAFFDDSGEKMTVLVAP